MPLDDLEAQADHEVHTLTLRRIDRENRIERKLQRDREEIARDVLTELGFDHLLPDDE